MLDYEIINADPIIGDRVNFHKYGTLYDNIVSSDYWYQLFKLNNWIGIVTNEYFWDNMSVYDIHIGEDTLLGVHSDCIYFAPKLVKPSMNEFRINLNNNFKKSKRI